MTSQSAFAASAAPFNSIHSITNSNQSLDDSGKQLYFGTASASAVERVGEVPLNSRLYSSSLGPNGIETNMMFAQDDNDANDAMIHGSSKRPVFIDLLDSDDSDDEEEDRKMPAMKRRRTSSMKDMDSLTAAAMAARLQEEEELQHAERKMQEQEAMYKSPAGRAFVFVERMIQEHGQLLQEDPQCQDLELVGQDDMVFLAEKFMECELEFAKAGLPTHVMLAYHYTHRQHLHSIRRDGLLSHPERHESNIHTKHGAYFGEGVYVGNNPYGFRSMGDTCLLVAIRKGREIRVGPGGSKDPHVNTVIGNKARNDHVASDEIVLRRSWQVLPILQFPGRIVQSHGSLFDPSNARLWTCHLKMQGILDEFFNNNVPTPVQRITPWSDPLPSGSLLLNSPAVAAPPSFGNGARNPPVPFVPNLGPGAAASDPFAPTPISTIRAREAAAAVARAAPAHIGNGSTTAADQEKELRRQKERFLMFTRVLIKYLETKDPTLHGKVKKVIKECAERIKRQEPGYESVTAAMRERIKEIVGNPYWNRAESYLAHFLAQKKRSADAAAAPNKATLGDLQAKASPLVGAFTTPAPAPPFAASAAPSSPTATLLPPPPPPPAAAVGGLSAPAAPTRFDSPLAAAMSNSQAIGTALAVSFGNANGPNHGNMSGHPPSSNAACTSLSATPSPQKNKFILEYLELNHPQLHKDAVLVKTGCVKRHKRKEWGYGPQELELRIQEVVKQVVGDAIWQSAELHADVKIALLPTQNVAFSSLWGAPAGQIAPPAVGGGTLATGAPAAPPTNVAKSSPFDAPAPYSLTTNGARPTNVAKSNPQPPPQNQPPPTNKSKLSQRLKSLHSPANHASKKATPAPAPPPSQPPQQAAPSQSAPPPARPPTHATSTSGRPPHHSHHPGAPPPTQPSQASQSSHNMTSQTQMQRQSSQSNRGPPPGSSRSAHPQTNAAAQNPPTHVIATARSVACTRRVRTLARSGDCSICSNNLQRKGKILQLVRCGCLFHEGCITAALQRSNHCPKCKT
ncbi:expressed unknown protein [Seminavis robusta]|uniref:RING-type domain-containing protein n=1 Tax=Seminavis robusta TaxID=568900 RepID=A0A9N8ESA6_9STRA|nr:expressed unknown protein [Seminavis robusta]|eukprot:Sro1553_g281940.1 n/a (1023) ;mRNA; r:12327-15395